jgi:hypothetical protein
MRSRNRVRLILILAVAACGETAFCQEVLWNQPYSGNAVSGPFAIQTGKLPNCPDCDCSACQPDGSHGLLKRVFGRVCHKFHRCRRECYFNQQIYHTGYTRPVLPPYCEPGFGYFETSWRQPVPCLTTGPEADFPHQPDALLPHLVPVAPMPMGADTTLPPDPAGVDDSKPAYENGPVNPLPTDPPAYDEAQPNGNAGVWQSVPRPADLAYPYQSFRR